MNISEAVDQDKIIIGTCEQRYGVKTNRMELTATMASPVIRSLSAAERIAWGVASSTAQSLIVAQITPEADDSGFVVLLVTEKIGLTGLLGIEASAARVRIMSVVHPRGIVPVC